MFFSVNMIYSERICIRFVGQKVDNYLFHLGLGTFSVLVQCN